jgi:hypothetical protein
MKGRRECRCPGHGTNAHAGSFFWAMMSALQTLAHRVTVSCQGWQNIRSVTHMAPHLPGPYLAGLLWSGLAGGLSSSIPADTQPALGDSGQAFPEVLLKSSIRLLERGEQHFPSKNSSPSFMSFPMLLPYEV